MEAGEFGWTAHSVVATPIGFNPALLTVLGKAGASIQSLYWASSGFDMAKQAISYASPAYYYKTITGKGYYDTAYDLWWYNNAYNCINSPMAKTVGEYGKMAVQGAYAGYKYLTTPEAQPMIKTLSPSAPKVSADAYEKVKLNVWRPLMTQKLNEMEQDITELAKIYS